MKLQDREYTKKELACMLYPELSAPSASQQLRRNINTCRPLMDELRRHGYHKNKKRLTPRQLTLIIQYIYPDRFDQ